MKNHDIILDIQELARSLLSASDLDPIVNQIGTSRFVGLGEASHGTHEFYQWRATLSQRLIEEHGFTWIGVEGDWPDCWRINQWVRGLDNQNLNSRQLLARCDRWPTWMWANDDVADFLTWLREHNARRPRSLQVGFYGLDIYSLWDSLDQIINWLTDNAPDAVGSAMQAWRCFVPYAEDPHKYAWSTRLVPKTCETEVVALLVEMQRQSAARLLSITPTENSHEDADTFDALQNAEVVAGAEHYYRSMMRGDRESWNIRDIHMADTVDRLAAHLGPASKGLLWEHNTHIGDARATDMSGDGLVNVGELLRIRHSAEGVSLVGFASHRGSVLAADAWGSPERVLPVPESRRPSHESFLHDALGANAVLAFGDDRSRPWLSTVLGHRAIGVVYHPDREAGNYVSTRMGGRYDALLWFEETTALRPLHHERTPEEAEYATEPTGF
jgi:erythromycin esterase